jgi:hypothetical protein
MRYLQNLAMLAALSALAPAAWAANLATADILACMKVGDDTQRLACFDRQAAALVAAQSRAIAPAANPAAVAAAAPAAPAPAPAKLTPEQKVGLTRDKVDALEAAPGTSREPEIRNFTAAIKSISVDARHRQVYELDNGQLWHQSETKPGFTVHPGDQVRISKAALGSFFMELQSNKHQATRVSRVR